MSLDAIHVLIWSRSRYKQQTVRWNQSASDIIHQEYREICLESPVTS